MDTSETYIKMCEKAWGDIKKSLDWRSSRQLYFCTKHRCFTKPISDYHECPNQREGSQCTNEDWVELPTQDQLQEMAFDESNNPDTERAEQITRFYHFCMQPYRQRFTSMEQLWLAFVMKERYNKTWAEGEWHKEG